MVKRLVKFYTFYDWFNAVGTVIGKDWLSCSWKHNRKQIEQGDHEK